MIRIFFYSGAGKIQTDLARTDLAHALQDKNGLLWVDFQDAPDAEVQPILEETFGFHHLAIEDALLQTHVPKLDDWTDYLYIVLHAIVFDPVEKDVDTHELDVFLGYNYLVTHHDQEIEALNRVWTGIQRDVRHLRSGADHVLYRLVDEIVASYMPVVEQFDLNIDQLEDEIFKQSERGTLEQIFSIKRSVLFLRRILAHQREVLNKLARDEYSQIDAQDRVYFRDVYDHLVRLYDITEGVRDLISSTLDTYLSAINNRMNDVMKTLTVITTLFMPLTFITGFFGMNFFQPATPLDVWTGKPAFLATILIVFFTPLVMYNWMRHRRWM